MAPLKIVGFLPIEAGEGIMLPKDITTLSGSDFDVDKLYIVRRAELINYKALHDDYIKETQTKFDNKKVWDAIYQAYPGLLDIIEALLLAEYDSAVANEDFKGTLEEFIDAENKPKHKWLYDLAPAVFSLFINSLSENELDEYIVLKGTDKSFNEWRKEALEKELVNVQRGGNFKYRHSRGYGKYSYEGRLNIIFDTLYGVLTSELAVDLIFVPGNFDEPKKYGYMAAVMDLYTNKQDLLKAITTKLNIDTGDYKDKDWYLIIDSLKTSLLKDLIASSKNLVYNHVHLLFHKLNMVAGKLIGVFALNNVSHAFISLVDGLEIYEGNLRETYIPQIYLDMQLHIENDNVEGLTDFDRIYNKQGIRISSALASFLAASVDAVKDPVLNYMNINETTAGILCTLVRMGYDTELAMLFLTLPVIRKLIRENKLANESGYSSMNNSIRNAIEELLKSIGESDDYMMDRIPSIDKKSLVEWRLNPSVENDINLLLMYASLLDISYTTSNIVTLTKFNSVSAATGPMIADTILLKKKVNDALKDNRLNTIGMTKALNNPIIKTFREASLKAAELIFQGVLILSSPIVEDMVLELLDKVKGRLDSKLINDFIDFFMNFLLVSDKDMLIFENDENLKPTNTDRRNYLIKKLPGKIAKLKRDNAHPFYLKIKVKPADNTHTYQWLSIDTRGLLGDDMDELGILWKELYDAEEARIAQLYEEGKAKVYSNIALDLIQYNFMIDGLGFSPKTFSKVMNLNLKLDIPHYTDILTKYTRMSELGYLDTDSKRAMIYDLFFRNRHWDTKLVPIIRGSKSLKPIDDKGDKVAIPISGKNADMRILKRNKDDELVPILFIKDDLGNLYKLDNTFNNYAFYKKVNTLGGAHSEILEISGISGEVRKSIIETSELIKERELKEAEAKANEEVTKVVNRLDVSLILGKETLLVILWMSQLPADILSEQLTKIKSNLSNNSLREDMGVKKILYLARTAENNKDLALPNDFFNSATALEILSDAILVGLDLRGLTSNEARKLFYERLANISKRKSDENLC